jgi:hypothetical protein
MNEVVERSCRRRAPAAERGASMEVTGARALEQHKLPGLHLMTDPYDCACDRDFALPNFVLELLRSEVPLVTDEGPRLDQDSEFNKSAYWTTVLPHSAAAQTHTCHTHL